MFATAARMKLRFASPKGYLMVEDLFDLPLTSATGKANLDDIAKDLHRQIKDSTEVSFVTPASGASKELQVSFEIVKFIINERVAERDAAVIKKANLERKQQIMAIIAQKENTALSESSIEDLRKMIEAM
jgi:hypothetical protein